MKFAIIKTGGKQYRVKIGDVLKVEKIKGVKNGEKIKFDVLLFKDENKLEIGMPLVKDIKVIAEVLSEAKKGKKVSTMKFKNKTRYLRRLGHRRIFTVLKILGV